MTARPNLLKRALRAGKRVAGVWILMRDPAAIEIAGHAGWDFALLDMEHAGRDFREVLDMIRAADVVQLPLMVRTPDHDNKTILRLLEMGVQSLLVPWIETEHDAREAVAATHYPTKGERGSFTGSRAAQYGFSVGTRSEYQDAADDEILLAGMLESPEGIRNVDVILDAGIELPFVGTGDLSAAMGISGQNQHPDVVAAVEKVRGAALRRPSACWPGLVTEPTEDRIKEGYAAYLCVSDQNAIVRTFTAEAERLAPILALEAR